MRIAYLAAVNTRLKRKVEHLRLQNDRLTWLTGYHLDLIQELKNGEVEKWLKDERERNNKLVAENAELKKALEENREVVGVKNQLVADNRKLKTWLEQYRALSSQLVAEKAELKKGLGEKARDAEEIRQLKIKVAFLEENKAKLEAEIADIEERFEKTRELVGEQNDTINSSKIEITRLISENFKLRESLKKNSARNKELERMNEAYRSALNNSEVKELRIHCANLQEWNDSYAAKNEELLQTIQYMRKAFERERKAYDAALEKRDKRIRELE